MSEDRKIKNNAESKRDKDGAVYYIRGRRTVEGRQFQRYAVATHFIERGEDYLKVLKQYIQPLYQEGDIISMSEKVISMCQDNTVEMKDVKLGFWAKFLSKFAMKSSAGIGMNEPYKLQLAINMKGLPLVLWASFCSGIGKIFHKRGIFYEIVGQDVAGIDGFYSHSAFETYHTLAVLNPKEPEKVCENIKNELGYSCILADANDLNIEILGLSPDLREKGDAYAIDLIGDNPAGQDDELTPFIIIREIKENQEDDMEK
ncbi:MAG: coenzyme F420-0:L-glutamate ligase [Clostridia bacterium]|nr:coenzyme F420-0:L-glutamate ligase [Clostridia bacterium]